MVLPFEGDANASDYSVLITQIKSVVKTLFLIFAYISVKALCLPSILETKGTVLGVFLTASDISDLIRSTTACGSADSSGRIMFYA
jgi:hypothetical protein